MDRTVQTETKKGIGEECGGWQSGKVHHRTKVEWYPRPRETGFWVYCCDEAASTFSFSWHCYDNCVTDCLSFMASLELSELISSSVISALCSYFTGQTSPPYQRWRNAIIFLLLATSRLVSTVTKTSLSSHSGLFIHSCSSLPLWSYPLNQVSLTPLRSCWHGRHL